jgi:hypothetical protein
MTNIETTDLTWPCAVCKEPIADTEGHLHIDIAEVNRREEEYRAFEKEHTDEHGFVSYSMADFAAMPDEVHWRAHHDACDPRPGNNDYSFPVERIRTHRKLLNVTAHLMEETWLEHTDWQALIRNMSGPPA